MRRLILTLLLWNTLWPLRVARADLTEGLEAASRMDWPMAFAEFQPLAKAGDSNAQVNLGNLYMRGLGVQQSYLKALHWYSQAAGQNNSIACSKLGVMHFYGLGVKQNPTEAARWFEKAARQGDPEAALVLASLYGSGRGIDQDRQAAYFWYTLAADWGKAEASEQRLMLAREMTPGEMGEVLEKLANWRNQTAEGPEPEGAIPADPGKPR